jgi:sporulation protein YlmC with PRC-barrel domain
MRLSELLASEVVTERGERLGKVRDVRLVRDGPKLPDGRLAYRVDALLVGKGSLGARLGLDREHVRRPWALVRLFGRRSPRLVPWSSVLTVGGGRVKVRADTKPVGGAPTGR